MEVGSIEITKRVAVIATALSLLLQIGCPGGVEAKSLRSRSKAIHHHHHKLGRTKHRRQIAQNTPTDTFGPAGVDESLLKFQDPDPEKPGPLPSDTPPRTPFAVSQDVGLVNVLKDITSTIEKPSALKLPENEQIVVGLARQILTQALRRLESSGQGVASGSANTKLWNSPNVKLSDRFHGSVAAIWRKKNEGMLTVTITGDCSDNTVIDGKKIGEFIVSIEARSSVDQVDENKWSANVSKVSVDADCCRGVIEIVQEKEDAAKGSDPKKDKKAEEKKSRLPDSFWEYDDPNKPKNLAPPVVAAPSTPSTPTVDPSKDTTTVEKPKDAVPAATRPVVEKDAVPVTTAPVVEAQKDAVPAATTPVVEAQKGAEASSIKDDQTSTVSKRNQTGDARAFQEQQKSQPQQILPWTENPTASSTDNTKSSSQKKSKRSTSRSEITTRPEQPEIQGDQEDDNDKYGVKKAEKEAADDEAAKKKAEKAERKKLKKKKDEDEEGLFVDKAIEKQEKESERESARAEKEAAKERKKAEREEEKRAKDEEKRAKNDPRRTSIEDLFNQDLQVGDEFMDTRKVERMERIARAVAAKKGVKEAKEPKRDKADDLLAQALAEEQGTPVDSYDEPKPSDEGIPDTFAANKSTKNSAPRKLFDRLDPDEEITPSAAVEKKPEATVQDRIRRANRPEGTDAVSADTESTTSGAFTGPIALRDSIADQAGSTATSSTADGATATGATSGDPISQTDEAFGPAAQSTPGAVDGFNRIRIPDEAVSSAEAAEHIPDRLIASNTARVRGKGGSIASKLFAQESAFSPNSMLSSRPVLNSTVPSAINSLGTIFDGSSKASSAKKPGLEAVIVMPDRAIAGENLTVAVLEKKNPEHEIELNFNGAPLATDSKGQAQYHVPEDATPGKTLLLSVTGRPELRCIEVIQPLAAPSSTKPTIDSITKLVVTGGVVTVNGHNFNGVAADNKVTIDNRDAEVVAASPLQLKVALPADLLPGTHTVAIKNDQSNRDTFDYVNAEVKLDGAKRTHLIVRVSGTTYPVHVRITNRTPDLIQLEQGDNVLVTTSGGKVNTVSVAVRQVKKDFKVDAEIEI